MGSRIPGVFVIGVPLHFDLEQVEDIVREEINGVTEIGFGRVCMLQMLAHSFFFQVLKLFFCNFLFFLAT